MWILIRFKAGIGVDSTFYAALQGSKANVNITKGNNPFLRLETCPPLYIYLS